MNKGEPGITIQDLVAYARESQELGNTHKVSGEKHLMHLLGCMAREAESEFGDKGLEMVERAVARFGEERGRRIARVVRENRKPLTLMNFFLYSDLDTSGNEMVPELVEGVLQIRVLKCSLADRLADFGLEQYGKYYCKPIDVAILKGYNPRLQLEVKSQLTRGADCCLFVYRQPAGSVENEE